MIDRLFGSSNEIPLFGKLFPLIGNQGVKC
jgi:hypothetical protein